jgi:tetratricopeptide (TPR) repeat protein
VLTPIEVGCRRCGRRATLQRGRLTALCQQCAYGAPETYEVRHRGTNASLAAADIESRLRLGALAGTDWVTDDTGRPVPLAAHPRFMRLFLPGHPDALAFDDHGVADGPAPVPDGRIRWYQRPVVAAVSALVLAASIAFTLGNPVVLASLRGWIGVRHDAEAPADGVDELVMRIGAVTEPRSLLVAQAWAERGRSTGEGRDEAIRLAERAVARSPYEPEALALLAVLYTEADEQRAVRDAALRRAVARAPGTPAVLHAQGVAALRAGRVEDARRLADACVEAALGEAGLTEEHPGCREVALAARPATAELVPQLLADYDALAEAWPANVALRARAAVLAADLDLPTAPARVAAVRQLLPHHPGLIAADARLRFADADLVGARALLGQLGRAPDVEVGIRAAESSLADGDPDEAVRVLAPWLEASPANPVERGTVRTLHAQALALRSMANLQDSEAIEALQRSARALEHEGVRTPASVQARLFAACRSGDLGAADRAWSDLDPLGGTRRDLARAWATRAAVLYRPAGMCASTTTDIPAMAMRIRDAARAAEDGVSVDPSEPGPHVWRMLARADVRDVKGVRAAIDDALRGVDGRGARRNRLGGALAFAPPVTDVEAALERLGRAEAGARDFLPLARATLAFLGGDVAAAAAALTTLPPDDDSTLGLRVRVAMASGDAAGALPVIDRLIARNPGESAWALARAEALVALQRWPVADLTLDAVRGQRPEDPYVRSLRAEALLALGRADAASAEARAALAVDPLDLPARRVLRGAAGSATGPDAVGALVHAD